MVIFHGGKQYLSTPAAIDLFIELSTMIFDRVFSPS